MKKIKMFVSVVIVIALMLSTLLVPASAATKEDILEPLAAYYFCPECEQMTARYLSSGYDVVSVYEVYTCDFAPSRHHYHEIHHLYDMLNCSSCGRVKDITDHKVYCEIEKLYF